MPRSLTRRHVLALCLLTLSTGGCGQDQPLAPTDFSYDLSPLRQWPGGPVTITSEYFRDTTIVPVVSAGGVVLEARRSGEINFEARLPMESSGAVDVVVRDGDTKLGEWAVEAAGFLSARTVSPGLRGPLVKWPQAGSAMVLGGVPGPRSGFPDWEPGGVGILDAGAGSMRIIESVQSSWLLRSPGLSPGMDHFWLKAGEDSASKWVLDPEPRLVETLPIVRGTPFAMAELDNSFLVAWHHDICISDSLNDAGNCRFYGRYEETNGLIMSPRRDQLTIKSSWLRPTGLPVFDVARGDTAYHVPDIIASTGAEFSPDGNELFVTGIHAGWDRSRVWRVNTADGSIADSTFIPAPTFGLTLDAPRGLLYVGTVENLRENDPLNPAPVPTIWVLDSGTLEVLGRMVPPTSDAVICEPECWNAVIVRSQNESRVYVVQGLWYEDTLNRPLETKIFIFDDGPADTLR